jgi:hypothetical protein
VREPVGEGPARGLACASDSCLRALWLPLRHALASGGAFRRSHLPLHWLRVALVTTSTLAASFALCDCPSITSKPVAAGAYVDRGHHQGTGSRRTDGALPASLRPDSTDPGGGRLAAGASGAAYPSSFKFPWRPAGMPRFGRAHKEDGALEMSG